MKIVCISDTHCQLESLSGKLKSTGGDLLLHAGDLTYIGDIKQMSKELKILGEIGKSYKYGVVFICGNHDWLGEHDPALVKSLSLDNDLTWLQQSSVTIDGIKIWGSAFQPEFCNWAFNLSRLDGSLANAWAEIPGDTNIVITHGPVLNRLDQTLGYEEPPQHVGCFDLKEAIRKVKPVMHVCGHIHCAYGHETSAEGVLYVNAAICTEKYRPTNKPIVVDYNDGIAKVIE